MWRVVHARADRTHSVCESLSSARGSPCRRAVLHVDAIASNPWRAITSAVNPATREPSERRHFLSRPSADPVGSHGPLTLNVPLPGVLRA